jgi:hypothetical protein
MILPIDFRTTSNQTCQDAFKKMQLRKSSPKYNGNLFEKPATQSMKRQGSMALWIAKGESSGFSASYYTRTSHALFDARYFIAQ